jgi:3-oxoacyl-[acyl-carrier protein] reductase
MKVLLTGGSRGIGKSIVKIFQKNNHSVYFPSREELDLSKEIILNSTNFDIIINCAGINPIKDFDSALEKEVMNINYFSPLNIIKQCLPYMIKNKYGRIVNIGSIWINLSKQGRSAYSASKNALDSISRSLTSEYAHNNILCNTVSPGFTDTELTKQNNSEEEILDIIKNIPVKKMCTTESIAELVYFLTVQNSYITGQNIIIDGGYSCTV